MSRAKLNKMDNAADGHKRRGVKGQKFKKNEKVKCRNTGQEIKTDRQKKESGTEKEDREGRMNRDWCQ